MDDPQSCMHWNYMQKKDVIDILEEYKTCMEWQDGEQILEIGCGLGDVTTSLIYPNLPPHSVMVGIDVSPEMINFCKRFKERDRIRYFVLDIQEQVLSTEWESETFDKILSFACLHWIHDYSQAVFNIYNLLKYGGDILLLFLTPDNPIHLAFQQLKTLPKWKRFLKNVRWLYEADDPVFFVQNRLREVGFQEIKCFPKTKNSHYNSWEAFMELVRSINPYTRVVPDELHQECLFEVSEILKQQTHILEDPAGGVIIEYNVIVGMAKKM